MSMTDGAKEIPPHYAKFAWKAGPKNSGEQTKKLNTEKVVQGAIDLVSKEGLDNLSIRKLSEHLGFTTMAVYRHIESREELLILMVDMGLGTPPDSILNAASWQEALRSWASELFARYQAHPWILDVPVNGIPTTPNHISWIEYFLQSTKFCNLTLQQKLDAALLIDGQIRNIANLTRSGKIANSATIPTPAPIWLRQLIDPRIYPQYSQVLEEGVLEDEEELDLGFGLECIIAGIEGILSRRDPPAS